jgi:hypothetical protein
VIEAGRQLTGHGTVHGPLRMNGYTVASGAGGLRFAGMLKGTGQGTGGNEIHFLAGGGFEGAGRIAADVYADSGSILRATGNVDLGVASVASLLVLDGRIETGPWRVIFWDGNGTNGVDLSGELVLGGGQVSSGFSYPLNVLSGARVSGSGTFFMPVVSSGTIAPGASAGKMRMVGSLTMSGGELEIEIGRFASGEWDTLSVDGAATLSGTLDVKRLPIFAVHFGDSIEVLHCTSRTGTFASVTLDGAPLAGEFAVHYTPNGVWLVFLQSTVGVGGGPRPVVHDLALAAYGSPGPAPGVELALPAESAITLEAYDVTGRRIVRFHEAALTAGRHRFDLAPHLRAAGLYFVRAAVQTERGMVSRTVRVVRAR